MKGIEYARQWVRDALGIFNLELRNILHDGGVMIMAATAASSDSVSIISFLK